MHSKDVAEPYALWPCWTVHLLITAGIFTVQCGCTESAAPQPDTAPAGVADGSQRAGILPDSQGIYHVHEGQQIQAVLDAAAADPVHKHVMIHAGTYRPQYASQAMIRFHARHDGLLVEGEGRPVLTAENPAAALPGSTGYPAVVNHVVYFGDGVSERTTLRGFTITGAAGFVTQQETDGPIEPNADDTVLQKRLFFYLDGGAIKIFGQSSPVLDDLVIADNTTQLCGGGISVEHRGRPAGNVRILNCVFRNNRCPATGSAIDLLEGSSAEIENCLFVGNIANSGMAAVEAQFGLRYNEKHGCGALTVFPSSRATVVSCTFTQNWNGADDRGKSSYRNCIFWNNTASSGGLPGDPYELDVASTVQVQNCWINGRINDLQGTVNAAENSLNAPDPLFDTDFTPQNPQYDGIGFRSPAQKDATHVPAKNSGP